MFRTNDVVRYMGMDVSQEGRILSLKSDNKQSEQLANGGVYLVNPSVLKKFDPQSGIKLSLEDGILPAILNTNAVVSGIECKGNFIDIGVRDDYFRAPEILLQ